MTVSPLQTGDLVYVGGYVVQREQGVVRREMGLPRDKVGASTFVLLQRHGRHRVYPGRAVIAAEAQVLAVMRGRRGVAGGRGWVGRGFCAVRLCGGWGRWAVQAPSWPLHHLQRCCTRLGRAHRSQETGTIER